MTAPIVHALTALALDDGGEIYDKLPVTLVYEPTDPWAVRLEFEEDQDGPIAWTVARCLLSQGLVQPTGESDFRVSTEDGMVSITLSNRHGSVRFCLDVEDIEAFVDESFAAVPEGTEHRRIDMDAALAELLAGA